VSASIRCDRPLSKSWLVRRQDLTPAAAVGRPLSSLYFGGEVKLYQERVGATCRRHLNIFGISGHHLLFPFSVVLKGNVITILCTSMAVLALLRDRDYVQLHRTTGLSINEHGRCSLDGYYIRIVVPPSQFPSNSRDIAAHDISFSRQALGAVVYGPMSQRHAFQAGYPLARHGLR
jgi:hypothetical protein